jgi:hypothetical protein
MRKNAIDLLTRFRFDVVLKYLYAKSIVQNYNTDSFKEMYKEHLRLWNGFREYDNPNKCTFEAFDEEFKKIIKSFTEGGFNPEISKIPILEDKYIVNGAHRMAAALATNTQVETRPANMPHDGQKDCSWMSHFSALGLSEEICDRVVVEYAKLKKDTYILTLFPTARGEFQRAISVIEKYGRVVYYKKVDLKENGPLNLMRELYAGEAWAGGPHDNWHGYRMKESLCYTNDSPTYCFLIELDESEIGRTIKNDIRNMYGVGNHSVHINDTHEQTVRLAKCLFNSNSIHHLNKTKPVHYSKFQSAIDRFKNFIESNNLDIDDYCVTASSVLSIYGLREGEDVDYLHHFEDKITDPQNVIHSHNEYGVGRYDLSYDEIIYNPKYYFHSQGVKFASLETVKKLKEKRGEEKDLIDINLINSIL